MQLNLQEHISRLLYNHECVVIPGFGAFLTRYFPAEINHATYMMRPPSKRVYFNSSIQENEGLLAKAISRSENISYSLALQRICTEVNNWKKSLKQGQKLNLPGIGRLYIDESSKLQFSPSLEINYSTASYGLSIFRSPAVQREVEIRKTIHKAIEKHIVLEHPETKKKKLAPWVSWAAVLGPVVLASVIGYSYFTTTSDYRPLENVSGINLFHFSRSASPDMEDIAVEKPVATEEKTLDKTETPSEVIAEESTETSTSSKTTASNYGRYHIIVGSFKEMNNAEGYIAQLKSKGYTAYLANGNDNFHRVAIGNFDNRETAVNALLGVKQNLNPSSWVYSN